MKTAYQREQEKDEDAPRKLHVKELLGTDHNVKSAEGKMPETDPNLARSMTSHQGIEKMLTPCPELQDKMVGTMQTTLESFSIIFYNFLHFHVHL